MVRGSSLENMERVKKQKILVTGGTGFIGSHLISALIEDPRYEIIVPFIEIDPISFFAVENLSKKITLEKVDITDFKTTSALIKKYQIDFIFHLAAQTIVTKAYNDPWETLSTNIMGTVNLLEIMRNNPSIQGMIFASSDKAYGKTKTTYTENFPLQGDHPYDVSKSSADLIVQMYFKTYKLPVVITRVANVYGEGDLHLDRIVPDICQAIIKNKPLQIRSDGSYVRDYIYVKDAVKSYLLLFKTFKNIVGNAYNISSDESLSVLNLIKKCEQILGLPIFYTILDIAKNEIPYQHLDYSKIKKIGYSPSYSLKKSLPNIVDWYKKIFSQ